MKKNEVVTNDNQGEVQKLNQQSELQSALIEVVKRTDIDPDRLEKFLDIQIKMEERQNKQAFNVAMAQFQKECPIIKKTKRVNFKSVDYNYAPLDEVVHVIRPIMGKYNLSFFFNIIPDANTSQLVTTISHSDGHEKKTSYFFDTIHDDARMNMSQRRKSAVTFAKRAALENALGIVTADEDDDAQRAIDLPITKDQTEAILSLMKNTGTSEERFFKFMQIEKLDSISFLEAEKAIHALKAKRVNNVQTSEL